LEKVRELAWRTILDLRSVTELDIELWAPSLRVVVSSGRTRENDWTSRQILQGPTQFVLKQNLARQKANLLQGVWKMTIDHSRSQLKKLRISGDPNNFAQFLKPVPKLCFLEELCIELEGQSNESEEALLTTILPFVASVAHTTKALRILSARSCSLRLTDFFFTIPRFPLLKSLVVQAHFDVAFQDEMTGNALTQFLSLHSETIRQLRLALESNIIEDTTLSRWLCTILRSTWLAAAGIQDLEISTTGQADERNAMIDYVSIGGGGLTSLVINEGYWTIDQVKKLFNALPGDGGMIREMSFGVRLLSASLWDFLAAKAWWLEKLKLKVESLGREGASTRDRGKREVR
jgi:hypothetical protein